ncbi:MAG: alkaline phosphatase [Planctomycetaceae bacterium]|jgi:alkaline phosphatase D|nr:alkaline phosphatase [Planctomycetaceae bacterium]MBT6157123.1 alkaline phosphatase [Planctomycetaceae bacterium]MBT6483650.1 alkaline phosphatase [Planctomycetaceae bacterium]MBT6497073.1 alkaline phosphatase [Planctomycetaceae bacterium]
MNQFINRRSFLLSASSASALPLISTDVTAAIRRQFKFATYPFRLGIASGDPSADGFVIWTRLAPKPLEGGGMPAELIEVSWEVANDEKMTQIIRKGTTVASPQLAHSVHVELEGLDPDRWYWYRFKAGTEISQVGRARTMPTAEAEPKQLRFAFASCQHYESGYYAAYRHILSQNLDMIIHLGDYIYEGGGAKNKLRRHVGPELMSLDQYRNRYAQYKTDEDLQAAHAAYPWFVTWDDHEFDNNYANAISEQPNVAVTDFLRRRANAYQAYYEHMPLRRRSFPHGPDMRLYQRASFGRLADFFVLDTRQYRTDQPNGDGLKPLVGDVFNPNATILGLKQRKWLQAGLLKSESIWNVIPQQVLMARVDRIPGDKEIFVMDKWSGYDFERQGLMQFLHERRVPNPIVLTGDVHSNFVCDLKLDYDKPDSPTVGAEFVGTSISSGGKGSLKLSYTDGMLAENPFLKFHNAERGYVTCTVTPKEWRSDYEVVADVTKRNSAVKTRASFVVEAGRPGVVQA